MVPQEKNKTFENVKITDTLMKPVESREDSKHLKIEENSSVKKYDSTKRLRSPLNKSKTFN